MGKFCILLHFHTCTSDHIISTRHQKYMKPKHYKDLRSYIKELENLNQILRQSVNLRTRQLISSYQNELESLNNCATTGKIAQEMLHDLNTPISSLKGSFELLNPHADQENVLTHSKAAVEQIERIVMNSRALINQQDTKVEFNPSEIIEIVLEILRNKINRNQIAIDYQKQSDLIIKACPCIFERIIMNLLVNAIEELTQATRPGKYVQITQKIIAPNLIITIKDNGRGIRPENTNDIFKHKFTTKGKLNFGIGLTFIKESIQKHLHGTIKVNSKLEEYTEFILQIPLNP